MRHFNGTTSASRSQSKSFLTQATRIIGRRGAAIVSILALSATTAVPSVAATVSSNKVDIALTANVLETISISASSSSVMFGNVTPLASNAAPSGQSITITSNWILGAGRTVSLYAYFDSASGAMTGASLGDLIPASAVTATVNTGATQAFTGTNPFSAGSTAATLYAVPITILNAITLGKSDNLVLALNLTGVSLHADSYSGTMHLQAQAL